MVGLDAPGRADARKRTDARRGVRAKGEGTRATLSFPFPSFVRSFASKKSKCFSSSIIS
jgi:hypothetical protein